MNVILKGLVLLIMQNQVRLALIVQPARLTQLVERSPSFKPQAGPSFILKMTLLNHNFQNFQYKNGKLLIKPNFYNVQVQGSFIMVGR